MLAVWRAALEQFEKRKDFVLATILSVQGSSPRHGGTRFLVRQDGAIVGTIGGGLFEAQVQEFAATVMQQGQSQRLFFSFKGADAQSTEMICGGNAEVLVEFVESRDKDREEIFRRLLSITLERRFGLLFTRLAIPLGGHGKVKHLLVEDHATRVGGFPGDEAVIRAMPEPRLLRPFQFLEVAGLEHPVFLEWFRPTGTVYIFGAGHVGACVAHLAAYVDFKVVVLDDRSDFASGERVPDADQVIAVDSFDGALADLAMDEDSYVVIVTRGHAHDKTVLAQTLRTKAGYIGMIGSRRKIKFVYDALVKEGFSRDDLLRVHAPIGLAIGGETPQEIGLAIVGEMIQIRHRKEELSAVGS